MTGRDTFDVVVIGAGIAGLVAARDIVRAGYTVAIVDAAPRAGGAIAAHAVGGLVLDSGAESFAVRGGSVARLIGEVGLGDDIVAPNPQGAWVRWSGGAAPLPRRSLLGIPGVALADDVRAVVGWGGALRAQLDRYMPLLRVRRERDLGELVRRRMGRRVLDRLVAPVVGGVHSAHPDLVDVAAVAPGLTQAMTVQGSLSGAVLALLEDRQKAADGRPGAAVGGIRGGLHRLVDDLVTACDRYGCELFFDSAVSSVDARGPLDATPSARVALEGGREFAARAVVVATSLRPALGLLASSGVPVDDPRSWPGSSPVTLVTLVLEESRLDATPRGTGVLVAEGTPGIGAKALTHATAKWAWLADIAGPGRHVLRLSYGRHGAESAAPSVEGAIADASALLGVPLDKSSLVDASIVEWHDALAFATVGHSARVAGVAHALADFPRLAVLGGWFDGTGLASIVSRGRERVLDLNARLRTP